MELVANILVGLVAVLHGGILVLEIFLWRKPAVHTRLGFTQTEADRVAPIVANAGLYNGFPGAGLVWGLTGPGDTLAIRTFFLACVVVAGVFGAIPLKWTTLVLQSLPAAAALVLSWVA